MDRLTAQPFAHRGLHGAGRSENGMAAFDFAIAAGFGIECDVRLSRDGVVFVHHDRNLVRMADCADKVDELDAATLDRFSLPDGGAIPRLAALLDRCGGRTPLLVEIKTNGKHAGRLCQAVAHHLEDEGTAQVAIMSFNPRVVRWFMRQRPRQLRGLVVTQQDKGKLRCRIEQALALWLSKPDFLACDIRDLPSTLSRRARRKGMPVLTWTVRSEADHALAARYADQIIFEDTDG